MRKHYMDIQQATIEWFRNNQRQDLPWRQPHPRAGESRDAVLPTPAIVPYHIWVSEVMSQQTQMDTVVPYFSRWIAAFPDIATLARASEESVKAIWSGMGYYRRALYLKRGAEHVMQHFGGMLPGTATQLQTIPGIGLYTSAAIASICFSEGIISVDGNVVRVLSRLRCERDFDPKSPRNIKRVFDWGQEIMKEGPCRYPGDFNQGLMEIGARICKPSGKPHCAECPLRRYCGACRAAESGEIPCIEGVVPLRAKAPKKKGEHVLCVVHEFRDKGIRDGGLRRRFVVIQRPGKGLLGGMLEFPSKTYTVSSDGGDDLDKGENTVEHICKTLCAGHKNAVEVGCVRHIFSHIDMHVLVYHAVWDGTSLAFGGIDRGARSRAHGRLSPEESICSILGKELCLDPLRISVKTEEEIRSAAASRLLLKILSKVSRLPLSEEVNKKSASKKRPRPN